MSASTMIGVEADLAGQGWARFQADDSESLEAVAGSVLEGLQRRRTKSSTLTPRAERNSSRFSLSSTFGLAAFDAHTDGAADRVPPRWCVMRLTARARTKTPTLLWDVPSLQLSDERLDSLRRAMWVVRGGVGTFYTSILRRHGKSEILRFNRVCMKPLTRAGAAAGEDFATMLLLSQPVEHLWQSNEVLVFDNWRVVHARPTVGKGDAETRRLERLLVSQEG